MFTLHILIMIIMINRTTRYNYCVYTGARISRGC